VANNSLVFEQETQIMIMRQLLQTVLEEADENGRIITPETLERIEEVLNEDIDDFVETLDD
jgi:hypothetical protein